MKKTIKRFYQFLWKYKGRLGLSITIAIGAAVISSLTPYFYKLFIDNIPERNYEKLLGLLALYVGVRIGGSILRTLAILLSEKALIPAARDVRLAVFRRIQDLDFAYHVEKSTGSLISAFKRGDGAYFDIYHAIHREILGVGVNFLVALYFFSWISTDIVLIMLALIVVNLSVAQVLIRWNIKKRMAFNQAEDEISGIITDNLLNYETVKFFAQEDKEEKRLRVSFVDWSKKLWGFANSFRIISLTVSVISGIGIFLMLWVTLKKLMADEIATGDFVMVASFLAGFYFQFIMLVFQIRRIARNYVDLQKYFAVLDSKIMVKDPKNPKTFGKFEGKIEFKDVDFSYPRRKKQILKDIDLLINPGESVAFVGRSGAGKTTMVRLLLRFYDLKKGKILMDGIDIRELKKGYLRSFIGVVPQEPVLFNNTIAFNIGYGIDGASKKKIKTAARAANLDKFIEELPEKYETEVGERGIKLSGGQKQRLAIARALLIDPKIIVFDEATSNLDSESEGLVQDALWKVAQKRTVLIIAHRFSTIRRVDKIVVMERGRIVEIGKHEELMNKRDGVYKKLWDLQVKGKLEKDEGGLLTKG